MTSGHANSSRLVVYAALLGNLAVAVVKFIAAAVTGSSAMLSEGVHSLVDTGNEVLLLFGMRRAAQLAVEIRDPLVLAFSTASSEAAYPKTLDALDRFGVPRKISSFVLPLGYSFNLDGSMMYCSFATIFIAQAYGIDLSLWQEITMLLLLLVTSKGMAGVPRASLVVIAATLGFFNIPEAGLVLILAVDHFLDMGRSATNVVGNAVATAVVAEWEDRREAANP